MQKSKTYFKGIKFRGFRGFRGFRKNREIKSLRKIYNWAIREIKSSRKQMENKTNPLNFQFCFKQTYTVFIRYNFLNVKIIVFSYLVLIFLISTSCFKYSLIDPLKFAKQIGQVTYANFAKYFEMVRPRN